MHINTKYLEELEEFSRRNNHSAEVEGNATLDNQEEDEGELDLGGEYEYDTRDYNKENDLDQSGVIIDHSDLLGVNPSIKNDLQELVPSDGTYQYDFQKFLNNLNIQHFSALEIMRAKGGAHFNSGSPCYNKNSLPHRSKWPFFARTIVALDIIRKNLGHPLFLVVAYRSKAYNECLIEQSKKNNGGVSGVAKFSQHLKFNAIDFRGNSGTPNHWGKAVEHYKDNEDQKVWFKVYNNFVHIDTRGNEL